MVLILHYIYKVIYFCWILSLPKSPVFHRKNGQKTDFETQRPSELQTRSTTISLDLYGVARSPLYNRWLSSGESDG